MKNIHVLPTDKPSELHYFTANKAGYYLYPNNTLVIPRNPNCINQYIYITSNEEIKEGDWCLFNQLEIVKCTYSKNGEYLFSSPLKSSSNHHFSYFKKIILTTDQDLIKDGVQAIDDEFLEWFVKNPSCEEVEVKTISWVDEETVKRFEKHEIIIPKEKPKQEIVGYRLNPHIDRMMVDSIIKNSMPIWNDKDKSVYFIRGHVAGSLVAKMKELQVLDLWFTPIYESEEIESDWVKPHHLDYYYKEGLMSNKSKQETLEEAAIRLVPNRTLKSPFGTPYEITPNRERNTFIKGAKWQQERSYSEEDIRKAIQEAITLMRYKATEFKEHENTIIEQFKKK